MRQARPNTLDGLRLASASLRLEGVGPERLLRLTPEAARGFWAADDRWIAHLGSIATVDPSAAPSGEGIAPGLHGEDRFASVWFRALELLRGDDDGGGERLLAAAAAPRFYGGFSFLDDHVAEGVWASHPSSRFILPEVEVRGRGADSRMLLRSWARRGDDEKTEDRLRERLDAMRHRLERPPPRPAPAPSGPPPPSPGAAPLRPVAATLTEGKRARWEKTIRQALASIGSKEMAKVVVARTLDVEPEAAIDPVDLAMNLWRENRGTHVFLFEPVPGRPFLGAAPETIAVLRRGAFEATAVAGSISRGESPEERDRFASKLMESRKDRAEHAITVEDMVARLETLARRVTADAGPRILTLSGIQHLETRIQGEIGPERSILSLLSILHPTSAVCGLPRRAARDFLRREEPFERGWYAGPVGWFDVEGEGVFAPALRSAIGADGRWRLFAGAGIVEGSDPAMEWEETRLKFQPVLRAFEASGVRLGRSAAAADGREGGAG